MTELVDQVCSSIYGSRLVMHYGAYRPPLHTLILKRSLPPNVVFTTGVDIGCGTGYSSRALAEFCTHVYGIDSSQSMLRQTLSDSAVTYMQGSAESIPTPESSADIVTYAGVLFYTDLERAATELRKICKKQAQVLVYDFSVVFDPFIAQYGLKVKKEDNGYNHQVNFAGVAGFSDDSATVERIAFSVLPGNLAHLLLSEPHLYKAYMQHYNTEEPYIALAEDLSRAQGSFNIEADIFYTTYFL